MDTISPVAVLFRKYSFIYSDCFLLQFIIIIYKEN